MAKRYTIELRDSAINAWSEKLCVEADKNGEYVYYTDHAVEVARLEAERDTARSEVARMRPVVEAAVKWLSDLTEYAELELERTARDYRDKEVTDEQNKD